MLNKNTLEMKPFEKKVWLSSPTMHGEEIEYVKEAYETNWMSTVGANINEVERITCEKIGCKHAVALSAGTAALHMAVKLAGEELYGHTELGKGALNGKKVFCSDMTFDATVNPIVYEGGIPVFMEDERLVEAAHVFAGLLKEIAINKDVEIRYMGFSEAETVKLFENTYSALQVSFFNEMDTFAQKNGLDMQQILAGVCSDPDIGNKYVEPSFGYGGYCLPHDEEE